MDNIEEFELLYNQETNPENRLVLENELDDLYESYEEMKEHLYHSLNVWFIDVINKDVPVNLTFYKVYKALKDGKVQQKV